MRLWKYSLLFLITYTFFFACDGESQIEKEARKMEEESAKIKDVVDKEWEKYGSNIHEIKALKTKLEAEPCDRPKTRKITKLLYRSGVYREVIEYSEKFWKKCGKFLRIRWTTYEAHKSLNEWDLAIADATKLIEDDPNDKDFRWWRGIAYAGKEDWTNAAKDYEQSMQLEPAIRRIPFNLADVYEKMGDACEGIFPLEQFLHYHPNVRNRRRVRQRIDELYARKSCETYQGAGKKVKLRVPRSGVITARVKINGVAGRFIVDTGATMVAISQKFADKLDLKKEGSVLIQTASGTAKAYSVRFDEVKLQGLEAQRIRGVITSDLGDVDGLLGMSFLSRYDLTLDAKSITIEAR